MCIFQTYDPIQKRNQYSFCIHLAILYKGASRTHFHGLTGLCWVTTTMMCRNWKTKTLSNPKWAIQKAIAEQPWKYVYIYIHKHIHSSGFWRLQASTPSAIELIDSLSDSQVSGFWILLNRPQDRMGHRAMNFLPAGLRPGGSGWVFLPAFYSFDLWIGCEYRASNTRNLDFCRDSADFESWPRNTKLRVYLTTNHQQPSRTNLKRL